MAASDSYQRIWEQAALIPEGSVATYGQIARLAGLPRRAARMVGRAVGAAPAELQLPWHRIVNAQGRIAIPASSPAFERQHALLRAEGVVVSEGRIDMTRFGWDPSLDELLWGPGRLQARPAPDVFKIPSGPAGDRDASAPSSAESLDEAKKSRPEGRLDGRGKL